MLQAVAAHSPLLGKLESRLPRLRCNPAELEFLGSRLEAKRLNASAKRQRCRFLDAHRGAIGMDEPLAQLELMKSLPGEREGRAICTTLLKKIDRACDSLVGIPGADAEIQAIDIMRRQVIVAIHHDDNGGRGLLDAERMR